MRSLRWTPLLSLGLETAWKPDIPSPIGIGSKQDRPRRDRSEVLAGSSCPKQVRALGTHKAASFAMIRPSKVSVRCSLLEICCPKPLRGGIGV